MSGDALLTVEDVAALLAISKTTAADYLRRGEIPSIRLGTGPSAHYRVRPSELDAYLDRHSAKPAPATPATWGDEPPSITSAEYFRQVDLVNRELASRDARIAELEAECAELRAKGA